MIDFDRVQLVIDYLVVQIDQSVGCVCVCLSGRCLSNKMTFDLDICHAG